LFFSGLSSFLSEPRLHEPRLIIVDNADGMLDSAQIVSSLRQSKTQKPTVILVIVKNGDVDSGVAALKAGANDYLPYSLVTRELAVRVDIHWSTNTKSHAPVEGLTENFDSIYPEKDKQLIEEVVRHIQANVSSLVNVGELAFKVGRSEREINKIFNFHLGQTVYFYMRNYRMNKAKALLSTTRLSIAQLALEVGYSNPANFSTAFKSVVGISPMQYRAQHSQR